MPQLSNKFIKFIKLIINWVNVLLFTLLLTNILELIISVH